MNIRVLEACYFDIASEKGRNCIPSDCIKKNHSYRKTCGEKIMEQNRFAGTYFLDLS
jgi:hypothetical protein